MSAIHTGWRIRTGPTTDMGDVDNTEDLPLSPTVYAEEPLTNDVSRYGWISAIGTIDGIPAEGTIVGPLEGVPGLPIAAPTGLVHVGFTGEDVDLAWDLHPDATITGIKVYRDEVLIATIANPAAVTYQDTTAALATPYVYEVAAYRGPRLSPFSNDVDVTVLVVPGAPTITSITPGDTTLSVAFTAPASNGGAAITNYQFSTNNGSSYAAFSPADTTTPLEITGLTNATTYDVLIKAVNSVGAGAASNMVQGTP